MAFLFNNGSLETITESSLLAGNEEISQESMQLLVEAMIFDNANSDEIEELTENHRLVNDLIEMGVVEEASIVRLDKQSRTNQLQRIAVFTIAKEKNDPDFRKLMTIWRMERNLENRLYRKYGDQALRRAKKIVQTNYRQRGNIFTKITDRAEKKVKTVPPGGVKQGKSQVVLPKKR